MSKQLEKGGVVPIPCRHCLRPMRFMLVEGTRRLTCDACGRQTEVVVESKGGSLLVFTSRVNALRDPAPRHDE